MDIMYVHYIWTFCMDITYKCRDIRSLYTTNSLLCFIVPHEQAVS